MAVTQGEYPNFPIMECSACNEQFEVPRKRVTLQQLGLQIIIDWDSAELLMKTHHENHNTELISGIENLLREDAQRKGK